MLQCSIRVFHTTCLNRILTPVIIASFLFCLNSENKCAFSGISAHYSTSAINALSDLNINSSYQTMLWNTFYLFLLNSHVVPIDHKWHETHPVILQRIIYFSLDVSKELKEV